nr:hypothetical protein [Tanacetum cinerariifolium]
KCGTVTCYKCGQKGHNKRRCKGPIVAGSGAATVSQTPRERQASTSGPASAPNQQGHPKDLQVPLKVAPNHNDKPKDLQVKATSASTSAPQPTRQTQRQSVAASGS